MATPTDKDLYETALTGVSEHFIAFSEALKILRDEGPDYARAEVAMIVAARDDLYRALCAFVAVEAKHRTKNDEVPTLALADLARRARKTT
jgi:hypothetical protein